MTFYQLTPFARRAMRPAFRDVVALAEPRELRVHIGLSIGGWTCRITDHRGRVHAEVFAAPTVELAFRQAKGLL